jgi:hypothetical protein
VTGGVLAGFLRFIISIVRLSKADLKVRLYDNRGRSTGVEAGLPGRSLGARDEHRPDHRRPLADG